MRKCILITGGFGYLGGRIAVELAREQTYQLRLASRSLVEAPFWLSEAETTSLDVLEPSTISDGLRDVCAVVHLASMNEIECLDDPQKAVQVNTLGTLNVLQAAIQEGVERFIYFSTAHVYGAPLVGNISEDSITRSNHPYAITHRAAEDFVLAAHDQSKIEGIVVRLSNGFGAPTHVGVNRWTLLVNDLCRQAVREGRLVLRSSGLNQRDFITLSDVGRAVKFLISLPKKSCGDGLFNLGGETSLSIWEMARLVAERCQTILGMLPDIHRPLPESDAVGEELIYCIDKLKKKGFRLEGRAEMEIDSTLQLCMSSYPGRLQLEK